MKIGLIGYGYWGGGFVARNIARVADLAVIVDPNVGRLMEAAAKWTPWGTRVSSEPEVAFRECDAVWIATPARTHHDLCVQALEADCHVMCEKPFVMDVNDAAYILEEAERLSLVLQVGFTALYMQSHRQARHCVANGRDHHVRAKRYTSLPSESDVNVLWGLGPHDIAAVIDLFGPPLSVEWSGNDHRVHGVLGFDGGHTAQLKFDWLSQHRFREFIVDGVDLTGTAETIEPLFKEAEAFVRLCETDDALGRAEARSLARSVTEVLAVAADNLAGVRA